MTREYRILVLTDHIGHSDQNSIYAILSQMLIHPRCHSIDIASRGLSKNTHFFDGMQRNTLIGNGVTSDFHYTKNGDCYLSNLRKLKPHNYDVVLMRLPRPISDDFLRWVEEVFTHAIMINKPSGIIVTSNKSYLVNLPDLCPHIRLCKSVADIEEEIAKYPIVLKPLKEYGGHGLLRIDGNTIDDGNKEYDTSHYLEALREDIEKEGILSMKYLKNVSEGDKRILVVGGEILAASLRIPAKGSWLCNVAQGGTSVYAEVTLQEREIINTITPKLAQYGIFIYGVDTLVADNGDRILSEINTMSIGGFPQAEAQTGRPIIKSLIDKIFEYADERTN